MKRLKPFYLYDPYLSFTESSADFLDSSGKLTFEGWHSISEGDKKSLWGLGKKVFDEFGGFEDRSDFDSIYKGMLVALDALRETVKQMADEKKLLFETEGNENDFQVEDLSYAQLVDIAWQILTEIPEKIKLLKKESGENYALESPKSGKFLGGLFLLVCLFDIEDAIVGMFPDSFGAVSSTILAMEHFANFQVIKSGDEDLQKVRSKDAANRALSRWKNDPTQKAKKFVRECWKDWQKESAQYKSDADFTNQMLKKVDVDKDGDPVIAYSTIYNNWLPKWKKEGNNKV